MANIVIAFESTYGQTHKIAEYLADRARRHGHRTRLLRASTAMHGNVDDADAYVVVTPVYIGKHPRAMRRFLRSFAGALASRPIMFVSVANSAAKTGTELHAQAEKIAQGAMDDVGLHPFAIVCAAGALAYPRYNFFVRYMMKQIAKTNGGPLDTTRIHELTDWDRLDTDVAPFFAKLTELEATPQAA